MDFAILENGPSTLPEGENVIQHTPAINQNVTGFQNPMNMTRLDNILDLERASNQKEPWNKLDKTRKTYILHCYSEIYGKENELPLKNVKQLKMFFNNLL